MPFDPAPRSTEDGRKRSVLLTVSGTIPASLDEEIAAGRRPRADYRVLAEAFDADVVDVERAVADHRRLGRLLVRVGGPGLLLGWYCFRHRRRYAVVVTDGEQVGIPYAVLTRVFGRGQTRHMMIVHVLSTPLKRTVMRVTRCGSAIDRFVVYASAQARAVSAMCRVPTERIVLSTFMVDSSFFRPSPAGTTNVVCSAGLERRDYDTLIEAVRGLDVQVVIAAASPWSTQRDTTADRSIPDNVTVRQLSLYELRRLYAECALVVMPLREVDFQAGITTILEAMSMALPVVVSRTAGQTDSIVHGRTGFYVRPGDATELRNAITSLIDDPDRCHAVGNAAREWVLEHADIEIYARRLAAVVDELRAVAADLDDQR